jgi:molybdopterin/thiamine biosynthesis adenylyltransferase
MTTARALPKDRPLQPCLSENATVKVIGGGGIGEKVFRAAAMFLASLGRPVRLVLIDGDNFEPANATRMQFSRPGNKAEVLRDEVRPSLADTQVSVIAVPEFVTPENIGRLVREGEIILAAVDNHATRKLLSDHCGTLRDVCLMSAGNDGVGTDSSGRTLRGTFANVQIYVRRGGRDATPSLTHFHPEIADPADKLPTDLSCTELVATTGQIIITNIAAASALLNAFWLHLCGALHYAELCLDIADGLMRPLPIPGPMPVEPVEISPLK